MSHEEKLSFLQDPRGWLRGVYQDRLRRSEDAGVAYNNRLEDANEWYVRELGRHQSEYVDNLKRAWRWAYEAGWIDEEPDPDATTHALETFKDKMLGRLEDEE